MIVGGFYGVVPTMKSTVLKAGALAFFAGLPFYSHALEIDGGQSLVFDGVSSNFSELIVGLIDDENSLTLTNGASVTAERVVIGELSNDNLIRITGTNSALTASDSFEISPEDGGSNHLIVEDNGMVTVGSASGTAGAISIGSTNSSIGMTIENGSSAIAASLIVGTATNEAGTLTLSGTDSQLTVDNAFIGTMGSNSSVNIEAGATFTVSNLLQVGSATSVSNSLNIYGETVIVGSITNGSPNANKVNIERNGKLTYTGDANLNNAEDNGFKFKNGSTLEIGGALTFSRMDSGVSVVLNNNLNTNLTSVWNTGSENMYVGENENDNHLSILAGASAIAGGDTAYIGKFSDRNSITVDGTNSTLSVSNRLVIGASGSNNSLEIRDGASATIGTDLRIGVQSSSDHNLVELTGTNSSLHILGSVQMSERGGFNNGIALYDQTTLHVEQNFTLHEGSYLEMHDAATVTIDGNYLQYDESELQITLGESSAGITNLTVIGDASFASNSTIRIFNDGTLGSTNIIQQTIVSAGDLWAGTNLTTELTTEILNGTNMVNFVNGLSELSGALVTNDSIVLLISTRTIAESSGLVGTSLEPLADEIDFMAEMGNSNAIEQIAILDSYGLDDDKRNEVMLDYYGEKESSIAAHNVINMGVQNVAEQLTMRADNTRYNQGMAASTANWAKPAGVAGPHESNQALQGWINAYGSKGSMSSADGFESYDASLSGFMIGLDASIRDNWLIGFAGGSSSSSIDQGGADTDTKSIYGAGYASFGTEQWFADMGFIYGNHDVDYMLGSAFDTKADYTSQTMSFFAGGGKEFITDYLILTPQLSFLGSFYGQESYEEKSSNAVAREIDSFDTFLLQSSLGGSMGFYSSIGNFTFKPEIRAFWQHEWLGEEEKLNYTLIGGTGNQYDLLLQAPEKDILKLGIGSSAKLGDYLELRADLDTRFGKDYNDYTLLGSLRYQF